MPSYLPPLTAPYPMDLNCTAADGSRATCAPSFCSAITGLSEALSTPTCVNAALPTVDASPSAYLSALTCSTCTASNDARCTSSALAAVFSGQPSVSAHARALRGVGGGGPPRSVRLTPTSLPPCRCTLRFAMRATWW